MNFEEKIKKLITESVGRNPELFILDMNVSPDKNVQVTIDGYKAVPLSECIRITREVEEQMDREQDDFSLTVTTPDITQWFTDPRQLAKNKGRRLKVHTASGETWEGTLVELDDEKLVLEDKVREPKPVGKGKHTVIKRYEIPLKEFDKAKVKIQF